MSNHIQEMIDFEDLLNKSSIYGDDKHVLINESLIDFRNVNFVKEVTINDNHFFYGDKEVFFFANSNPSEPMMFYRGSFEFTDCICGDKFSLTGNITHKMMFSNCHFNGVSLSNIDNKIKDEYSDKLETQLSHIENHKFPIFKSFIKSHK